MIGKKIVEEKAIAMAEVRDIIEKRKKEGELSYEQNLTLEYCKKFNKLKMDKTKTLVGDLQKLDNMDEKRAIELANLMPKKVDEVRLIFAKERFILSEEDIKKTLEVLDKYR